ncbi:hypothetical protein JCM10213_007427 [Rhodosporidiobolus nylandii]
MEPQQDLERLLEQYDTLQLDQQHATSPLPPRLSPAAGPSLLPQPAPAQLGFHPFFTPSPSSPAPQETHPAAYTSPFLPPDLAVSPFFEPLPRQPLDSRALAQLDPSTFDLAYSGQSTPSYAASWASDAGLSECGGAGLAPSPAPSSSSAFSEAFDTRYYDYQQQSAGQEQHSEALPPPLPSAPDSLLLAETTMAIDSDGVQEQQQGVGTSMSGAGRAGAEPERDATLTVPRRRAAEPLDLRLDTQRPFAFKRSSSGFSSFLNYAAGSPTSDLRTSDLRTRPSTPAESATRSTFGGALSDSPPTSSVPFFGGSPAPVLAPLDIPSAPALQLTGPTPETARPQDRPKGKGTLELERVLGMWAAKTPTSSFPNLPPLSSSATAPSSTQPLFSQVIVASEPESFFPAPTSQPDPVASTSSALFVNIPREALPASTSSDKPPRPGPFDSLAPPLFPPRRQRSKSEADIMNVEGFLPHDFGSRYLPSFAQQQQQEQPLSFDQMALDVVAGAWGRPPSAPSAYTTTATPHFASLNLDGEQQHELSRPARPSLSRPRPSAGGPGYHEAAYLDVPGGAGNRRAKSQGAGHRRTAKSDDFSHLFSPSSTGYPSNPFASSASASGPSAEQVVSPDSCAGETPAPSPPTYPPSAPPQQAQPLVQGYLANGQPVLVPASFLTQQAAPAYSGFPSHPAQYPQPPTYPSQQPHPLALAAAHAQAQAQGLALQYAPYGPIPSAPVPTPPGVEHHRGSVSSAASGSHHSRSGSPSSYPHPSPAYAPGAPAAQYGIAAQRTPYAYQSPIPQGGGIVGLPSPPMTHGGAGGSPGSTSQRSGSEAMSGGEDDAVGSGDEEEEEDVKPLASAPAKGKAKGKKRAAKGDAGEEEFSKESKTTQATIDAAKRRRNANAVAKFVCELCGETFTRRYNLRGHQRAHRNEKPYKCSYDGCEKAFARAHDCKRHELLHLGVRKYHCGPCKRDFVRLDALHRHHRSEVGQACVKQLQLEGHTFDEKGAVVL